MARLCGARAGRTERAGCARARALCVAALLATAGAMTASRDAAASTPPRLVLPGLAAFPSGPASPRPPDLSRTSPRATLVSFESGGTAARGGLAACVTVEVSGWVDEAKPIALERLGAMGATAVHLARGAPPRWHTVAPPATTPHVTRVALAGDAGESANGMILLTFLEPEGRSALACWAACYGADTCDAASAELRASPAPAPPPTLGLRALVLAVHHPRAAAGCALALCASLAGLYVRRRPRPRARD